MGERLQREGTYVYRWLIHVNVWQKPTQYCNYPSILRKKSKLMASSPIISWQISGEKVETVTDFSFLDSKITADGDCSQKIKRLLLLERKPRQHIKKQTLLYYVVNHIVKAMDFSSSHVWM